MSSRRLAAVLAPASWIVLGIVVLAVLLIVGPKDAFGLLFGLAFGVACLGVGAFQLWRLSKENPNTTVYTIDDLPLEQRASALRRVMFVFGGACLVLGGMTLYDLIQLEYGSAERVSVWAPVASLYRLLGFWPAALFIPAIGLLGILAMARKLRTIRTTTSRGAE
jgi:hypothetical protein